MPNRARSSRADRAEAEPAVRAFQSIPLQPSATARARALTDDTHDREDGGTEARRFAAHSGLPRTVLG